MKKLGALLACLMLMLGLSVINAHAYHYSRVEAWANSYYGSDESYVYLQDTYAPPYPLNYHTAAEARAQDLALEGGSVVAVYEEVLDSPRHASTLSTITQSFKVTEIGTASINFSWAGWAGWASSGSKCRITLKWAIS